MTSHRIWKVIEFVVPTENTDDGFREVGRKQRRRTVDYRCECGEGFDDVDNAVEHIQYHD